MEFPSAVMGHAREFVARSIYVFSELEQRVLRSFFTNTDRRVFFMHSLPSNVAATLLAMYSRIKNPRGLRGVFVDNFLPEFLASFLGETENVWGGEATKFLKARNIDSLGVFYEYSVESGGLVEGFLREIHINPDYLQELAESKKTRRFTDTYLDKYGHNSIARPASYWLGFEQISILAAKSIEWGRPGETEDSSFIELSTRYVDMSGKDYYPADEELGCYGVDARAVRDVIGKSFGYYRELQGENFSGPFPRYLRETFGHLFRDEKDLANGVVGETCDVLGNFLPAATLTSVGVHVSGEALPELLRHLILDKTPENLALVEAVISEASKIGAGQFIRHYEPTEWKWMTWQYLRTDSFSSGISVGENIFTMELPGRQWVEDSLVRSFGKAWAMCGSVNSLLFMLKVAKRKEHDKLPNQFERVSATLSGVMSFRGWRDVQRQSLAAHFRTYLTPLIGFYSYDKEAPESFFQACREIHYENARLYLEMQRTGKAMPPELAQYPLALGNLVGFEFSANLLEWEFCNWQRTKYSVNHEVRQVFLTAEKALREEYPWWSEISRTDTTEAYVFARTKEGVPLHI